MAKGGTKESIECQGKISEIDTISGGGQARKGFPVEQGG